MCAAEAVRARGILLTAIDAAGSMVGTIIVVPPGAPAVRLAGPNESEMHLLAVSPDHRNAGIGERLVKAAIEQARSLSQGMVLWTQPSMHGAQRLYVKAGFHRDPARDFQRAGRAFLVYSMTFGPLDI
jgi:ribosomal protein S18 acetylase RimI-like enzyme